MMSYTNSISRLFLRKLSLALLAIALLSPLFSPATNLHPPLDRPLDSDGGGVIVVIEDVVYCVRYAQNPSTDDIIHCLVQEEDDIIVNMELFDLNQQSLLSQSCESATCNLDVSGIASGDYLLVVETQQCVSHNLVRISR